MPAKSQAQRAFIYATKGKAFAEAHHFDNKGKLPEHVGDDMPAKKKSRSAKNGVESCGKHFKAC